MRHSIVHAPHRRYATRRPKQSLRSLRTNLCRSNTLTRFTLLIISFRTRTQSSWLQYTQRDAHQLFTEANLRPLRCWTDADSGYSLWLLERPPFNFRLLQSPASEISNTPFGVPSLQDFEEMWAAWDFITQKMIPDSMMLEKPIDLRHICLFYTGHIPTFLDIHLSRLLGEPHTEPEYFKVRAILA